MRARNLTETQMSDGICPLDKIPIRDHDRCFACGILIGPRHYARTAIMRSGEMHCADCAKRAREQ